MGSPHQWGKGTENDIQIFKEEFKSPTDSASVCESDPRSGETSRKHSVTAMQHP